MARERILYKLPLEFQEKHRQILDDWDWTLKPEMALAETLPDVEALADVRLELASGQGRTRSAGRAALIVRVANGGRAQMALRRYAESIAAEKAES